MRVAGCHLTHPDVVVAPHHGRDLSWLKAILRITVAQLALLPVAPGEEPSRLVNAQRVLPTARNLHYGNLAADSLYKSRTVCILSRSVAQLAENTSTPGVQPAIRANGSCMMVATAQRGQANLCFDLSWRCETVIRLDVTASTVFAGAPNVQGAWRCLVQPGNDRGQGQPRM